MNRARTIGIALGILAAAVGGAAQADPLQRLQEYIEVDTTNPPGNETRGVEFFSAIFDAAGVAYETAESAPGRGNIWARLDGGDAPALVLLHHMDVVPATLAAWDTPPLQAVVKDGQLFGRGALDTKSLGIMHLEAFLALHESGVALSRDIVFVATADEEAGGRFGAGWLLENRPEVFAGAGYLLNEGGAGIAAADKLRFQIEVAQKRPYWLRLIASDEPGHGSSPRPTSAPTRLVEALHRIHRTPFAPRVTAPVRAMFKAIAPYEEAAWQSDLLDIDRAIADPAFVAHLAAAKPHLNALIRNTCSITVLAGSGKINVVPPSASAELDCRILPDQDATAFLAELTALIGDHQVRTEEIMLFEASQSSADTDLYRLLEAVARKHHPEAGVVAAVATGFTDSHFFRERGIASYGFSPLVVPVAALGGIHGNNERIGIAAFERGVDLMKEIVTTFAVAPPALGSVGLEARRDVAPVAVQRKGQGDG